MTNFKVLITVTNTEGKSEKIRQNVQTGNSAIRLQSRPGEMLQISLEHKKDANAARSKKGVVRKEGQNLVIEDADGNVLVVLLDHFAVENVHLEIDTESFSLIQAAASSNDPVAYSSLSPEPINTSGSGSPSTENSMSGWAKNLGISDIKLGNLGLAALGALGLDHISSSGSTGDKPAEELRSGNTDSSTVGQSSQIVGVVTAGPVAADNGLTVIAFKGDGTKLGEAKVQADGRYTIEIGDYKGVVFIKTTDQNANADYLDEATSEYLDLSITFLSVSVVDGSTATININPLTTIAARKAGLAKDGSGTITNSELVKEINSAVAKAFGLSVSNLVAIDPDATNDGINGSNDIGKVLAVLSGMDIDSGGTDITIDALVNGFNVSSGQLDVAQLIDMLIGADKAMQAPGAPDLLTFTKTSLSTAGITQVVSSLQAWRPTQVSALSPVAVAALTTTALASLDSAQAALLSPQQISTLSAAQVVVLPTSAIANLQPETLASLNPAQIASFTPTQAAQITPAQVQALRPAQVGAIPAASLAQATPTALASLDAAQAAALTEAQLQNLSPTQVVALPVVLLASLSPLQIAALTIPQGSTQATALVEIQIAQAISPTAAALLSTSAVDAITPAGIAGLQPAAVASITPVVLASFSETQLAAITPAQAAQITTAQVDALSAAQVSALSPVAVAALTPAALASLDAAQVAVLAPAQISSLGAAQVAALPVAAIANLQPETLSSLSPAQVSAFTPTQAAQITPTQVDALSPAQVASLPATALAQMTPAALASLDATQVAALSPAQLDALSPTQVAALPLTVLASLSTTQLAAVTPDLSAAQVTAVTQIATAQAITPTDAAALTTNAVDAITPAAIAGLQPAAVASITPVVLASFSETQLSAITPAQAAQITTAQVDALSAAQVSALSPVAVAALTPAALASLDAAQVAVLAPAQISSLGVAQVAGLPTSMLVALNSQQIAAINPQAFSTLSEEVFSGFSVTQLTAITSAQAASLSSAQIDALIPAQMAGLTAPILGNLTPAALSSLDAEQVAALTPDQLGALSQAQVAALSLTVLSSLSSAQLAEIQSDLSAAQVAALQVVASTQSITAQGAAALTTASNLSEVAISALKPSVVSSLTADFMTSLSANQIAALTPGQVSQMTLTQMDVLTPSQVAGLSPAQMAAVSPAVFASLDLAQMAVLSPAQISALSAEQVSALTPAQLTAFTPVQMASLPLSVLSSLTNAQMTAVDNELTAVQQVAKTQVTAARLVTEQSAAALAPSQVSAMSPAAISGLDPAVIDNLTIDVLASLSLAQVGSLTADQAAQLTTVQVAAMSAPQIAALTVSAISEISPAAIAELDAAQINALSLAQIQALTPIQVAALPLAILASLGSQNLAAVQANLTPSQSTAVQQVTAAQALSTSTVANFSASDVDGLTDASISGLKPAVISSLSSDAVVSLDASQIAALSPLQTAQLTNVQVNALTPTQVSYLNNAQLSALNAAAVASLDGAQLASIDDLAPLSVRLAQLDTQAVASITDSQLATVVDLDLLGAKLTALNVTTVASISASQLASLSDIQALGSNISYLSTAAMASLTPLQLSQATDLQLSELTPTQYTALLNSGALNLLTPAQQTILTTGQVPPAAPSMQLVTDSGQSQVDGITGTATLVVDGLVAGAGWDYRVDGGEWVAGTGNSFNALAGSHTYAVRQSLKSWNPGYSSPAITVVLDDAAQAPTLVLANDTGLNTDGITSVGNINVLGLETGATWQYSTDGGTQWLDGNASRFVLTPGNYLANSLQVRQTDVAGNVSAVGQLNQAITVDATAAAPSLALATDAGSSASDGITNVGTVNVSGVEAGGTWQYSTNAGSTWTNGSGSSFTLAAGNYVAGAVQVRQTDVAGNSSAAGSNGATLRVDSTAPTWTGSTPADGDFKVGPNSVLMVQFGEAIAIGSGNIRIVNDTDSTTLATVAIGDATQVSISGNQLAIDLSAAMTLGKNYHLEIDAGAVKDVAGNAFAGISGSTALNFSVPDPAISIEPLATNNIVNGAENASSLTVAVVLTSSVASIVSAAQASDFAVTLSQGAQTVTVGNLQYDTGTGRLTGTVAANTLAQGAYTVNVVFHYGSETQTATSSVQVDIEAPAALGLALAQDTGTSGSDGITQSGSMNVTGIEALAQWEYSTNSGSSWSAGVGSSFTLAAGSYAGNAIQVRQTDAAGNTSAVTQRASAVTVDNTAPTITSVTPSWGGTLNTSEALAGGFVNVVTSGVETGQTVTVRLNGTDFTGTVTGNTTSVNVSATALQTLVNGATYSLTAKVSDAAGNAAGPHTAINFLVNTGYLVPSLVIAAGENAYINATESVITLEISYVGMVAGDLLQLKNGASNLGSVQVVLASDVSSGKVTVIVNKSALGADGVKSITAVVTDSAENSGTSNALNLTLDAIVPTANFTAATDNVGSLTGALASGARTDDTSLVLSGTNEAGGSVQVFNGTTALGAATVSGTTWSYTATVANDTTYQFNVKETDTAGNISAATSNFTVVGDSAAPTANFTAATDNMGTMTGALASGASTDDTSLALIGTNEAGGSVQVFNGTTALGAATVSGTTWSYTATVANGTTYQFNVKETDTAGNISAATSNFTVVGDTTAPTANFTAATDNVGTMTGALASGASTDDTILVLSGTNEAGGSVQVFNGTTALGAATVSGTTWSYTATVANGTTYQFNVKETDVAGNTSAASSNFTAIGDTTSPTLAITSNKAAVKAGETATITFTFSEDPDSSFAWNGTAGDVVVIGGTLGAISGIGLTRTATFTPMANVSSLNASITVASGTYTDAAGNSGGAGTTPSVSIDTLAPTLSVTSDKSAVKAGETATITFSFSEDPGSTFAWDGTSGDLVVTGGALSAISGTGLTRTATFTPTANVNNVTANISVASSTYTDRAGNNNVIMTSPSLSGVRLQGTNAGADTAAQVTALTDGGYVVTWQGATSDSQGVDIYVQRYNSAHGLVGFAQRLRGMSGVLDDTTAQVTALSGGAYVVAWQGATSDTEGTDVFVQRFDSSNVATGALQRLKGISGNLADTVVQVSPRSNGGYLVAWQGATSDSQGVDVFVQSYDNAGSPVGDLHRLQGESGNLADGGVQLTELSNGDYLVTWHGLTATNNYNVFYQRFSSLSVAIGSPVPFQNLAGDYQDAWAEVLALANGGFVVSWYGYAGSNNWQVFVDQFDSAGASVGARRSLYGTSGPNYADKEQKLASLSDGGYVVAWRGQVDGQFYDIFLQRFSSAGAPVGSLISVRGVTAQEDNLVQVVGLSDGGYVVAWEGNTTSESSNIFVQRYNSANNAVGATIQLRGQAGANADTATQITALSDGGYVVTWSGATTDGQLGDVFMQRFDANNNAVLGTGSVSVSLDTGAPTASVNAASIFLSESTTVQSTEAGTAYLVNDTVVVSGLSSITSAADHLWNQISISTANTNTSIAATGLAEGTYRVYAVDAVGNFSSASSSSMAILGGFAINGELAGDYFGGRVTSAGDVNGDGLSDFIVAAQLHGAADAGRSYVVFGRTGTASINASAVAAGTGGFAILGEVNGDQSGMSVSAAGDVNGDGLDDLVVGAAFFETVGVGEQSQGRSYVVFGRTGTASVNLSTIAGGTGGFAINGQTVGDQLGTSVSGAGDVNGDGLADLIVGARLVDSSGVYSGRSYVVFGRTGTSLINASDVVAGVGGFVINGHCAGEQSGIGVSAAGDVNGDGLGDLIVGAWANAVEGETAGRSYVVFGRTGTTPVNASAVVAGTGGFAINGQSAGDLQGFSVSGVGDVNGDGLADLIVGAINNDYGGVNAGRSFVVFGRTASTNVIASDIVNGVGGFVINAESAGDNNGMSVSNAGDINGDGLADLIVGARGSDVSGVDSGRSYVIFGRTTGAAVNLSAVALGSGGFAINGQAAGDSYGMSVSAAGDVNGDGLADLIVGAPYNDTGATDVGRAYVILGSTTGAFAQTAVDNMGTTGADTLSDSGTASTLVGNAGNDTLTATAASVLYGGSGDDVFQIGSAMITALQSGFGSGGNTAQLARMDGGGGVDTLALSGTGLTLDLAQVSNQAASSPDGGSRIDSIEKIDLTGSGNNILNLTAADVRDMAGFNTYQATGRRQLMVLGDAGDQLLLGDSGWRQGSNATMGGTSYAVLNHSTLATIYVSTAISYPDFFAATPTLAFATETGVQNDRITSVGTVTVSGLEPGAAWQYSTDGGLNWIGGTGASFTLAENSYAHGQVVVRQTDAQGNTSGNGALAASFAAIASQRLAGMSGNFSDTSATVLKLSGGGYVLGWTGATSDSRGSDVFIRRFAADGTLVAGSEQRLSFNTLNQTDFLHSIVELSGGNFVVAWTHDTGSVKTVKLQILNSSWTPLGSVLSSSNLLASSGNISGVTLIPLTDGGFGLAYTGANSAQTDTAVFVQKFESTGALAGSLSTLGVLAAYDQNPNIYAGAAGAFTVSWRGRATGQDDVYVQEFLATGVANGSSIKLPSSSGVLTPGVVMLSDGDWISVTSASGSYNMDIYVRRYSSAFALETTTVLSGTLVSTIYSEDYSPTVAVLSDGGYAVAWLGKNTVNSVIQNHDVWVQRFALDGSAVGPKTYLSGLAGNFAEEGLVLTALADGRYVVSWVGPTSSNALEKDVFFQVFESTGVPFGAKQQLGTPLLFTDTNPKVTALANGSFVIAWEGQSNDSQGYEIFSRVYAPGNVIVDATAPVSLSDVSVDLKDSSDSGTSNSDNLTNVVRPTVTVNLAGKSLVAGDLVQIINTSASDAVVGTYTLTATDAANGITSIDVALFTDLFVGTNNLKVRLADLAGNQGAPSSTATTVTVDATAPTLTWSSISETGITFIASDSNAPLTAFIGASELAALSVGNGSSTFFSVSELPSALSDSFFVKDSAGNASSTTNVSTNLRVSLGTSTADSFSASWNMTTVLYGFGGNDTLISGGANDLLFGGDGNDYVQGWGGNDFHSGGNGNDVILAGDGNDTLNGDADDDSLNGQVGNDVINGGTGNDSIRGGDGVDQITLGEGLDTLIFDSVTGADTVNDFSISDDLISLAKSAMAALGATGALTADEFVLGAGLATGQDVTDRIVYNTTSGALYYDADGSGAGAAVLLATFTGAPALTVSHFTII